MLDRIDSQAREIAELTATRDANGVWFSGEFVARLQAEVTALRSRLESAGRKLELHHATGLIRIKASNPPYCSICDQKLVDQGVQSNQGKANE